MTNQPEQTNGNGNQLSMKINPGFDRDPLRPKTFKVLVEVEPGQFQIIGTTGESIEMLRLNVEMNHACGFRDKTCVIVDDDSQVVGRFDSYVPEIQPEDRPITKHNLRIRSRWIAAMIKWLLPVGILDLEDTPENADLVRDALKEKNVEISISPSGTKCIIFRDDLPLADWSC